MLNEHDRPYLLRALEGNKCVLFVGAGFSHGATNRLGRLVPGARELAQFLWGWLGYSGAYDDSPLEEIYQGALASGRPLNDLRTFLEDHLLAVKIEEWYGVIPKMYWHRIYGTNVDNVLELTYQPAGDSPILDVIDATKDDYKDRDQFLGSTQYVKLNGTLPGDPRSLTFATRAYAKRSAEHDIWYDHFVRDYVTCPTVFVGSELREPLFWQAIETRQRRGRNPEERPRSFLVAPSLSPAKAPILEELHVRYIPGSAEEFFRWLRSVWSFPSRSDVLRLVAPEVAEMLTASQVTRREQETLTEFLTIFQRVPEPTHRTGRPRTFFLGAPPTWEDLANDFDAPRDLTRNLLAAIEEAFKTPKTLAVLGVLGAGGAGKSTILHRAALTVRQSRTQVYFSEGSYRPDLDAVSRVLDSLPGRAILFIDNAHLLGPVLYELVARATQLREPPIVVFAARYNLFESQLRSLATNPVCKLFEVSDLTDAEIGAIISTLDRHTQLGKLEGMSARERFEEFKVRARKQILVAMREATQGQGFNDIIRNEFSEIDNEEARVLFLCAAIATAEAIDLSREQWLACSSVSPADTLAILSRNLGGLAVEDIDRGRISSRHPIIAEFLVDTVAPRQDLKSAYSRLLATLSHDIYPGVGRRIRSWRLFVRLISHKKIYERFRENIEMARSIYQAVASHFRRDGHFWLQFASLEIEFGQTAYARPLLAQAESLMPDQEQVLTTKAHLAFKEAMEATTYEDALTLRRAAEVILIEQIWRIGSRDEYPYHVYLSQFLAWVRKWEGDATSRRKALQGLVEISEQALDRHGYSRRVKEIAEKVKREYLNVAVSK